MNTQTRDCDLLIIGAGPAGLAAAVAAARARPERSITRLRRQQTMPAIGESLPPGVRPYLDALGLWSGFLAQRHRPSYATAACWGGREPLDNPFLLHPEGHGWQLQRERFDHLLAVGARALGVHLIDDTPRACTRIDAGRGWQVQGAQHRYRCRLLVDASGRNAALARRLAAKPLRHDRLVGVYRFYQSAANTARDATPDTAAGPLIEAWRHGWWYSAGLPCGGLVCAAMVDADGERAGNPRALSSSDGWRHALRQAPHTAARLANAHSTPGTWVKPAHSQCLDQPAGDDWIAIGDACHCTDPLAADGIRRALHDGLGIGALLTGDEAEWPQRLQRYRRSQRQAYSAYLDTRTEYYRQETRWPDARFWARRHRRIELHPLPDQHAKTTLPPTLDRGISAPSATSPTLTASC